MLKFEDLKFTRAERKTLACRR